MASFAGASRKIVIRTSRDTLGLLAAATAMTFALSYAVHSKHDPLVAAPAPVAQDASPRQDWAGGLAELTPAVAPTPAEPMTSASLTVPKSQLALPTVPKPVAKPRPCLDPQCAAKAASASASSASASSAMASSATPHHLAATQDRHQHDSKGMIGMLNPLNHLPDMSVVARPFTYAGGAVTGWFKRL